MRAAPQAVLDFVLASNVCWRADLITITLLNSTVYRWTTAEHDIVTGGFTYSAGGGGNAPIVKRSAMRQSTGLVVDTLDMSLLGPYSIGGQAIGKLGSSGHFDGARVRIDHLLMQRPGDTTLGAIPKWFEGRVAAVDPRGQSLNLRLKSELEALNVELPRFIVGLQCGHMAYDTNCGLSRGAWTLTGAVGNATTTYLVTSTPALTAKAAGYFDHGVVRFTSGALNGVGVAVPASGWQNPVLFFALPLPTAPTAGDTFTVYPGCDRSYVSCSDKFANLGAYRGFPHIPKPESGGA